jgi:hypothetical protein
VSLIPESLDTRNLHDLRNFLEEKGIQPKYFDDREYKEKPITESDLVLSDTKTRAKTINHIKFIIATNLLDAPYTYISLCGQQPKIKREPGQRSKVIGAETDNHKGVCRVNDEDMAKIHEYSDKILDDEWDIDMMAEELPEELFKEWKYEYAWDMKHDEAKPMYAKYLKETE